MVRYLVYKEGIPYESRTSRKNHQTVKCQIANSRNFSGIFEELHQLPIQDQLNCIFWLFVPLLDVLAILSDPEDWAELVQLPIHNLLLIFVSQKPVKIVQVNELD